MATSSIFAVQTDVESYYVFRGVSGGYPASAGALLLSHYNTPEVVYSLALNALYGVCFVPHPDIIETEKWYEDEASYISAQIAYDSEHLENMFRTSSGYGYTYSFHGNGASWSVVSLWDKGGEIFHQELEYEIIEENIRQTVLEEYSDRSIKNLEQLFDEKPNPTKTLRKLESVRESRGIPDNLASAVQMACQ